MAFKASSTIETIDYFKRLEYGSLIKCLSFYESGYNQNAVGKAGEIGILQFMPTTFSYYCSGSIDSEKDQLICSDEMLISDWDNRFHWTTYQLFCAN